ncbi:MAG: hypothetical protein ACXWG1_07795 [Usitatibacter sp.]
MRHPIGTAIVLLAFTCVAAATPVTKEDYKASKKRIVAEYTAERQKCGPLYGHAADLCIAQAHGTRDVAKAELEAAYKPGPRTYYDAAIARAKAAYTLARIECREKRGPEMKACLKDADEARARAVAEAKATRDKERAEESAKRASGAAR